jgi:hypothetical protein
MSDEEWDIRKLNGDQHRAVRRALNTLTKHSDPRALPQLLSILAYQPAMTHRVVTYAEAVAAIEPDQVAEFFDNVIARLSMNEWQRAWIAYGLRACTVSLAETHRASWLRAQVDDRPDSVSASEAAVALAGAGLVAFGTLESHLRTVSPDFAPWYLHAIAVLHGAGTVSASQIGAMRQSSTLAAAILK